MRVIFFNVMTDCIGLTAGNKYGKQWIVIGSKVNRNVHCYKQRVW